MPNTVLGNISRPDEPHRPRHRDRHGRARHPNQADGRRPSEPGSVRRRDAYRRLTASQRGRKHAGLSLLIERAREKLDWSVERIRPSVAVGPRPCCCMSAL